MKLDLQKYTIVISIFLLLLFSQIGLNTTNSTTTLYTNYLSIPKIDKFYATIQTKSNTHCLGFKTHNHLKLIYEKTS
jgi:hypothetical protein